MFTGPREEILLTNMDNGQVIRAFPTPNFSTHFVIENASTAYVAPLSYFPEEDEVLFPPLSRFLVREVETNFPRNPDKVTLVYLSPEAAGESHSPRSFASLTQISSLVSRNIQQSPSEVPSASTSAAML